MSGNAFDNGSIELMMLDYSKEEPVVVGKNLYRITDNNLVGNIVFKSGNWGVEHIDDEYSEVSSRVGVRYVRLEPGKYYYCIGQLTQKSRLGFGYYFEIVMLRIQQIKENRNRLATVHNVAFGCNQKHKS